MTRARARVYHDAWHKEDTAPWRWDCGLGVRCWGGEIIYAESHERAIADLESHVRLRHG